jgi:hypothetical protein
VKAFALDLWHDLRAKRLWPVAVLLVAALVAMPLVLLRSGSDEPAPAAPQAVAAPSEADEAAIVALADDAGGDSSALEAFDPKDPFAGPKPKRDREPGAPSGPAAGEPPLADGPSAEIPGVGLPLPGGGDGGGAGVPPSSGGGAGGGDSGGRPRKRVSYAWTVDVRFGRREAPRLLRSVQRLDVLPRSGDPLLVFLGVSPTGKSAIFLLDSDLEHHGDGRCAPSRDECSFLHLTLERGHDLHFLTTDTGDEYAIRLVDIQRERTDVLARRARAARAAERRRASTAHGGRSDRRSERRSFRPPFLAGDELGD